MRLWGFKLNYVLVITKPALEKKLGTLIINLLCFVPLEMGGSIETLALPHAYEFSEVFVSFPLKNLKYMTHWYFSLDMYQTASTKCMSEMVVIRD